MATSIEEMRIRLGMDASGMEAGTLKALAMQRDAALSYQGIWNKVRAEELAAETAFNDELVAIQAKRLARQKAQMIEYAEINAIGGGSGGFGSGFKTAEQKALEAGESGVGRELEHGAEFAAGAGGAAMAGKAIGHSGAFSEAMVLVREFFRGNYTRMMGSLTRFLGLLGEFAAGASSVVAGAALVIGPSAYRTYKAVKAEQAGGKDLDEATRKAGEGLAEQINQLEKTGHITPEAATALRQRLKDGGYSETMGVLSAIAKDKIGGLTPEYQISQADKQAAEIQKQIDAMNEKSRTQSDIQSEINDKKEDEVLLVKQMAGMDKNSVEYHQAKVELLTLQRDLLTDNKQIIKDTGDAQKEQQDAAKEWQKASDAAAREYIKNKIGSAMEGAEYPTLEDLAGRRSVSWLNRAYGRGGRYDLGRGNGPFAGIAYDALLAQKQQMWDRTYGNMADANADRLRYNSDVTKLAEVGAASPQMLLSKISDNTTKLQTLFETLVNAGVIIKGTE